MGSFLKLSAYIGRRYFDSGEYDDSIHTVYLWSINYTESMRALVMYFIIRRDEELNISYGIPVRCIKAN